MVNNQLRKFVYFSAFQTWICSELVERRNSEMSVILWRRREGSNSWFLIQLWIISIHIKYRFLFTHTLQQVPGGSWSSREALSWEVGTCLVIIEYVYALCLVLGVNGSCKNLAGKKDEHDSTWWDERRKKFMS